MLKYITTKTVGSSPKLTRYKGSVIESYSCNRGIDSLNLSFQDVLTITFEQVFMGSYLLEMNPKNEALLTYLSSLKKTYISYYENVIKNTKDTDSVLLGNIPKNIYSALYDYAQETLSSKTLLTKLATYAIGKSVYSVMPMKFFTGYTQILYPTNLDETILNPQYLLPKTRKDSDDPSKFHIICDIEQTYKSDPLPKNIRPLQNTVLSYFASFTYQTTPFKRAIDMVQRMTLNPTSQGKEAYATLNSTLSHWLFRVEKPRIVSVQTQKNEYLTYLRYLVLERGLTLDNKDIIALCDLMHYFGDHRADTLLKGDAPAKEALQFEKYLDLNYLIRFGKEADTSSSDATKDTTADDTKEDTSKDDTDTKDQDTDELGKDIDSAIDDTTDTDDSDSQNDDDFTFGDDSDDNDDNTSDSDTSDDSGSGSDSSSDTDTENEAKPEDVNPLITIIDSESFDEYLDRKTVSSKITALIANPPMSITKDNLIFLKHWYCEWMDLVSVETTRIMLKGIIDL